MVDETFERNIVIACIVSDDYIARIREGWDSSLLESDVARYLVTWCIEFFDQFGKAPGKDIHSLFNDKLIDGKIPSDIGQEIEEDILPSLNEEYIENPHLNIDFLVKKTIQHKRRQRIKNLDRTLRELLSNGEIDQAENMIMEYAPVSEERDNEIDFHAENFKDKVHHAFHQSHKNLIYYPGAFGDMINDHLIQSGFVAFMGINKIGKTALLLDLALRAYRQGIPVAFFQAGDLTEDDFIIRGSMYLTRLPYKEKDVGIDWEPVKDCKLNQVDRCIKTERTCDFGVFNSSQEDLSDLKSWRTKENLIESYEKNSLYIPCTACKEWGERSLGTIWLKKNHILRALSYKEALEVWSEFIEENKQGFKVATYPSYSLSVPLIDNRLELWDKQEGFQPLIIVLDYADYLISNSYKEFRHQQNDVWARLRGLSQTRNALIITVTQADAQAFNVNTLKLKHFSEDRRKFDHPTAFFGLNRDPAGLEKQMGLLRVNELALRESHFDSFRQVTVLQNLKIGRAFIGSYWSSTPNE
jgi:hypothetical protein